MHFLCFSACFPCFLSCGALSCLLVEGLEEPITISLCDSGELYAVISVSAMSLSLPMYFAPAE